MSPRGSWGISTAPKPVEEISPRAHDIPGCINQQVYIFTQQARLLREEAKERNCTLSHIVRELLAKHYENWPQPSKTTAQQPVIPDPDFSAFLPEQSYSPTFTILKDYLSYSQLSLRTPVVFNKKRMTLQEMCRKQHIPLLEFLKAIKNGVPNQYLYENGYIKEPKPTQKKT